MGYSNERGTGERAVINGHHETAVFQELLDKFIHKYVLCAHCNLPEIDMAIKKGNVVGKCAACGWTGFLDNDHKLAKYIITNPPDPTGRNIKTEAATGGVGKKDRQARKAEKVAKKVKGEDGSDDEDGSALSEGSLAKKSKKEKSDK